MINGNFSSIQNQKANILRLTAGYLFHPINNLREKCAAWLDNEKQDGRYSCTKGKN
jgi:hypothetical protein